MIKDVLTSEHQDVVTGTGELEQPCHTELPVEPLVEPVLHTAQSISISKCSLRKQLQTNWRKKEFSQVLKGPHNLVMTEKRNSSVIKCVTPT